METNLVAGGEDGFIERHFSVIILMVAILGFGLSTALAWIEFFKKDEEEKQWKIAQITTACIFVALTLGLTGFYFLKLKNKPKEVAMD